MDSLLDRHLGVEFGRHFLKATNAYAPAFEAIGRALDGQAKRAFLGSAEKHGEPKIGSPARQVGMGGDWAGAHQNASHRQGRIRPRDETIGVVD